MGGTTRHRGLLAAALLASAAFAGGAFASDGPTVTAVNGTFDDPGFLTGFQGVSPAPPGVPTEGVFHGTSHVYGTAMHGSVSYTLWGGPGTDGTLHFRTIETFTGFVAGCGQGTMVYRVVGTATSYGPSDPVDQHLQATWTIDPGSGTSGLSGVQSGGGTLDGTSGPTTANNGTITGSVTCAPAESSQQESTDASGDSVTFSAPFTDPGSRLTGVAGCPPGYMSVGGTAYFRAPLRAVDTYTGCLTYDPTTQSIAGETFDKQTGFLAGCGRGSFVMHQTDLHSAQVPFDSSGAARLTLRWAVVPGSGTGAFDGASGSGTGYGDFTAPTASSFPGLPNSGVYRGTITCPDHA